MINTTHFEIFNYRPGGNVIVVAPGLMNPESMKGINDKPTTVDPNIIIIPSESYYKAQNKKAFFELLESLARQGNQVLIEYNDDLWRDVKSYDVDCMTMVPAPEIVLGLDKILQENYSFMKKIYNEYYIEDLIINNIIKELLKHPRFLVIMSSTFNMRKALSEYAFFKKDRYRYV